MRLSRQVVAGFIPASVGDEPRPYNRERENQHEWAAVPLAIGNKNVYHLTLPR